MASVSIFSSEKCELQIGKKPDNFKIHLLSEKNTSLKNIFDIILGLKCSLQTPRTIDETMDSVFGFSFEISEIEEEKLLFSKLPQR